jgi:hypothetical protein
LRGEPAKQVATEVWAREEESVLKRDGNNLIG